MISKNHKNGLIFSAVAGVCLHAAGPASAQTFAPDAGQILREQPVPKAQKDARPQPIAIEQPAATAPDGGPRMRVKAVRIVGATLVPQADLLAQISGLVGTDADFRQLQLAALRLSEVYLDRGYLARALLPEQDLTAGVVEFQVVEGRRGALTVDLQGERIDAARVQAFVDQRLSAGGPMDVAALGEALNVLNEQPGANISVSLLPGSDEGAVDLRLTAQDRPLVSTSVGMNNQSSRGVGIVQAFGSVSLNNPTGRFDVATMTVAATEGSAYLRGEYGLPIGNAGTRVRAHVGVLSYKLVQSDFVSLRSKGTAQALGLSASHPLQRLTDRNLTLSAGLEHKRLEDETVIGQTGYRVLNVGTLDLNGDKLGGEIAQGELSYGLGLTFGDVDQRNAAALAADLAGRRTQGSFAKLTLGLGWRQTFASHWQFALSGRAQIAGSNLDSSEQISLGGPSAVRAYPVGEATGDEGWLVNAEVTRRLDERFVVGAFVDGGEIQLRKSPVAAPVRNRYGLAGAGLSLDWQPQRGVAVRLQLAAPFGNNPAAFNGNDADGRNSGAARAWVGVTAQF